MELINVLRKIALLAAITFFLLPKHAQSQLVNNGGIITVTGGAVVYTDLSLTNTANGTVINNGTIFTNNDIINDAGASLSGNGTYTMQGDFTNKGSFDEGTSVLDFTGENTSSLKNKSGNIYTLQITKDANNYVDIKDKEKILNSVIFVYDKNWVRINENTLTLGSKCNVVNYNSKRYFITNGEGALKKINITNKPFTFPVGFDKTAFNFLTITENGIADDYTVRCLKNALLNGSSGNPVSTDGIDVSWIIDEATAGGANATIQAAWNKGDELPDFDTTHCMVVRYKGSAWDFKNNLAGSATNRTISRSGFSSFGYFTVLSSKNPTFTNTNIYGETNSFAHVESNRTGVKIYPTIIQNNFNIDVLNANKNIQKMNVNIMDEAGKIVWQKHNADFQSQKISLPALSSGIYTVLIDYNNNKFVQKIIISR